MHIAARSLAVVATTLCLATAAQAQPRPPEKLKAIAMACDRHAMAGPVDAATANFCSVAWEELRTRVFHGDFERMLAWWRSERAVAEAAAPAGALAPVAQPAPGGGAGR